MADERKFFAGDLGTQHLQREVEVESPDVEVKGRLIKVEHSVSFVSKQPVTYVLVGEVGSAVGYALDPNMTVVVR